MSDPSSSSVWLSPSLYISLAALAISAIQACRSIRNDAKNKRRIEFIEFIAGEFAKIDVAFDALETKLRKASKQPGIDSDEILEVALPAMRVSSRALIAVSNMPAVSLDLPLASGVDELDEILTMADDNAFDSPQRNLHIGTALNIVTRVAAKCATTKRDVQSIHLE